MAWPVEGISAGCQRQITLVQRRGAKSLAYDLFTSQGVVFSRAVLLYCDLLRLSSDWLLCFLFLFSKKAVLFHPKLPSPALPLPLSLSPLSPALFLRISSLFTSVF